MPLQGGARYFSPPLLLYKKASYAVKLLEFLSRPRAYIHARRFFPINGVRRAKVLLAHFCGVCAVALELPLR
jgi:hypothetical protein